MVGSALRSSVGVEDLADGGSHRVEHARRAIERAQRAVRARVREVAGDLHDGQPRAQDADRHRGLERVATREGHGGVDGLARQAALIAEGVVAVPAGLAADEAAHHARPIAGVFAPGRGDGDRHIGLAGEHGLDEGGGLDGGLTQVGREQQDVAGRSRMAATFTPVSIAEARPRSTEWRTTTAPAARAARPVSSVDPSSTTMRRSTLGMARHARTVAATARPTLWAAMTAATRCGWEPLDPAG